MWLALDFYPIYHLCVYRNYLLRGTPESKDRSSDGKRFDVIGIIVFVIMMVSVNVVITQGSKLAG